MEPNLDLKPETAFSAALDLLEPGASAADIVQRFGWRVDRTTVANWRSGRRGIPRWAIDRVRAELLQRVDPISDALLQAKERPGLKAGALNLAKWRARPKP